MYYIYKLSTNIFIFTGQSCTTLRERQDLVTQMEIVKRLEEEKALLLREMDSYLRNIKSAIESNRQKLLEKQQDKTTVAVIAQKTDKMCQILNDALQIFHNMTEGDFRTDICLMSPNDDVEMLLSEFEAESVESDNEEELY